MRFIIKAFKAASCQFIEIIMKQFQICLFLSKQNYFLKFDLTQDRTRGPTDKVSGLPSEGRRFDSRLSERHFGFTFSSILGYLGMCLGVVWGCLSDGFGMVLENMSDGVEKSKFSKMAGSICPEPDYLKITFLSYPRRKILKF